MCNYGFRLLTENINVVIPYQFMDFYVCTIGSSKRYRTIEHKFHIACTGSFFGRQ